MKNIIIALYVSNPKRGWNTICIKKPNYRESCEGKRLRKTTFSKLDYPTSINSF